MNEELQSSNEELETSEEELQSVNEELETVNDELSGKIEEAEAARADLANMLASTRIAMIFLDRELRIRSFTSAACEIFRLVDTDVDRPISDVRCDLAYETLEEDAHSVIDDLTPLEREVESTDGRRFSIRVSPYRSDRDAIEGVVFSFIDVTRLKAAEARERWLATVVEESNDAVMLIDPDGIVIEWNRGAERMYGYAREEIVGRSFDVLLADGTAEKARTLLDRWRGGPTLESFETRRRRSTATVLDVSVTLTPVRDPAGAIRAFAMTDRDITSQKERQDQLEFLLRELDHRVRNILATTQAVVDQTASSTTSVEDFAAALKTRISALADLHAALGPPASAEVDVVPMAEMALGPHVIDPSQVEVRGDRCVVPAPIASAIFMALHELAINARKHGALSVPEGRVAVDVEVDREQGALEIDWRESGGPPVAPPTTRGFGTTVIERGLEYEAGGKADIDFEPGGLHARLTVPLPRERTSDA